MTYNVESHLILYDELSSDVLANLCSIGQLLAVYLDIIHTLPLVDDEDFICVSEPRKILQPVQVDLKTLNCCSV